MGFAAEKLPIIFLCNPASNAVNYLKPFETRFVASRALTFLPLFAVVIFVVARHRTAWSMPVVSELVAGLLFISWLAWRRVKVERSSIERLAGADPVLFRSLGTGTSKKELLPACAGGLIVGGIMSAVKHDIRWFVLGTGFLVLLMIGLSLRWLVYDRWLDRELSLL